MKKAKSPPRGRPGEGPKDLGLEIRLLGPRAIDPPVDDSMEAVRRNATPFEGVYRFREIHLRPEGFVTDAAYNSPRGRTRNADDSRL